MNTKKLVLVVLLLSMVLAACGGDDDGGGDPTAAVKNFVKAMEKLDVKEASKYMCAAHKGDVPDLEENFAEFAELGLDPQEILDAFEIKMTDMKYEEKSKDGDKAVVKVTGKMAYDIDADAMRSVFEKMLEEMGLPASDEMLDGMMEEMMGDIGAESPIDGDVNLVKEDGDWLVCDALDFLGDLDSGF